MFLHRHGPACPGHPSPPTGLKKRPRPARPKPDEARAQRGLARDLGSRKGLPRPPSPPPPPPGTGGRDTPGHDGRNASRPSPPRRRSADGRDTPSHDGEDRGRVTTVRSKPTFIPPPPSSVPGTPPPACPTDASPPAPA